jgi:transposase
MTQDEIIEMARQVGFSVSGELILDDAGRTTITNRMEAFARLVAAKEREACAKVCDRVVGGKDPDDIHSDSQWAALTLAAEIRARGNT